MEISKSVWINIAFFTFWILPVYLGIRVAKKKNLNPHIMWFGLHPFTGWFAFIYLWGAPHKIMCSECGEVLKNHARICAYCLHPISDKTNENKSNSK